MSEWDEAEGRVTLAFSDWYWIDRDQGAFLSLGLKFAADEYERLWRESGEEPGDPDGPDQLDSFEDKVDGLHEPDFIWMHTTGVLRDAVTNFEVYLEKARELVLRSHGLDATVSEQSPWWKQLRRFFKQLGVDVETEDVKNIRELRHFLTHRRGELRTEQLRDRYAATDDVFASVIQLAKTDVRQAMGDLGAMVRTADAAVYAHTWGPARVPNLAP